LVKVLVTVVVVALNCLCEVVVDPLGKVPGRGRGGRGKQVLKSQCLSTLII
jgi:hypothetical protein